MKQRWILILIMTFAVANNTFAASLSVVMDKVLASSEEDAWQYLPELSDLAKDYEIAAALRLRINSSSKNVAVVLSTALLSATRDIAAVERLVLLLEDNKTPQNIRVSAANSLGLYGGTSSLCVSALRRVMSDSDIDDIVRIRAAASYYSLVASRSARSELLDIVNTKSSASDEAVLALAEIGFFDDVKKELAELAKSPTTNGMQAKVLLQKELMVKDFRSKRGFFSRKTGVALFDELLSVLEKRYVDEFDGKNRKKLITAAAEGMLNSLDKFSSYLDRDAVRDLDNQLTAKYGGVGTYVENYEGKLMVAAPIYGEPADRAGIRSLDEIVAVDNEEVPFPLDTDSFSDVIDKLRGDPGSKVRMRIKRFGLKNPITFTVVRKRITVHPVISKMLPGKIGYIRLTRFSQVAAREVAEALRTLKHNGMKGLIFDLRNNPGGLLNGAVDVADLFLPKGKLVVYSQGRTRSSRENGFSKRNPIIPLSMPMITLINKGSASASEIVAGALRDHKRAILIGETSYGKGSVQSIIPLKSTHKETRLKLTVAKYYLPQGESIHEIGVKPHIEQVDENYSAWHYEEVTAIREDERLEGYARNLFETNRNLAVALAWYDGDSPDAYFGLNDLFKTLDTHLKLDDLRKVIRAFYLRPLVADARKKTFAVDVEDLQIARAIYELSRKNQTIRLGAHLESSSYTELFAKKNKNALKSHSITRVE